MPIRPFPPPWTAEEGDNYFVVRDREGQQPAYAHFDNPRAGQSAHEGRGQEDRGEYCEAAQTIEPPSDLRAINHSGVILRGHGPQPRYKPTTL